MNILALTSSLRQNGNSDILAVQALAGAKSRGADTRLVRLAELELKPCTGCMKCVFQNRDCFIKDGLHDCLEALRWADGVILSSPTYVLETNSVIKNLKDRLIRFGIEREFAGMAGVSMASAGVPGWEPLVLGELSLTFLFLGMSVVDQFVGYGQGPGEILDDERAMKRAFEDGAKLADGERHYIGERGMCPVCNLDMVAVKKDGGGYCSLCALPGTFSHTTEGTVFIPSLGSEPRWSANSMREHFVEKIIPSGPRFKDNLKQIRARVTEFLEDNA